jgi:hypothetical protein
MRGALAVMGGCLVLSFTGLLTCLLLVVGVKTEQRMLLLPWQIFHAGHCFALPYPALSCPVLPSEYDLPVRPLYPWTHITPAQVTVMVLAAVWPLFAAHVSPG